MLEDREDLETQLVLRERYQHVRLADRPFLPSAAVVPEHRRFAGILRERFVHRLQTHAVRAVRIGEVACCEDVCRPVLLQQLERDAHVFRTDGVLLHLARLVERQVQESRGPG